MSHTILENRTLTTRVEHRCWGCMDIIPKKTAVRKCVAKSDGQFITTYWCVRCDEWIKQQMKQDRYYGDEAFTRGQIAEERREDVAHGGTGQ